MRDKTWIDAIRERLDKATPGPWERLGAFGVRVEAMPGLGSPKVIKGETYTPADAEFIANAPTDIANLLSLVGRLREGLRQIAEQDYPADAGDAETWAREVLADDMAVQWEATTP